MSAAPAPAFRHPLRVYWEDTDASGVVYHANYLKFFERARTEWLRTLGAEQHRLRDETGTVFVVAETRLRCLRPARLDDALDITAVVAEAGRVSLRFVQQAWCGSALLAEGEIRIGCVDAGTFRPTRIPTAILQRLA